MKKYLLLNIILLNSFLLLGQTYHPFPTNIGEWSYRYHDDFHIPTTTFTGYSLSGDTVISGTNYKKIFTGSIYSGALRENSKVIYFYPDTASQEYILYDFNLGLGDTIIHPYGGAVCSNDTITVDLVDSILTSDGMHYRMYLSSGAEWIEGIGSIYYLLNPANVLCVSGNDLLEYMEGDSVEVYNFPNPPPPPPPSCLSYYYTTYDSISNTFNLSVPSPVSSTIASYLWDFGDGTTSTLISPSHYYPIDSIYNVCMNVVSYSGDSCSYCHLIGKDSAGNIIRTGGFTVGVNLPVGINPLGTLEEVAPFVYPNPSNGQLNIEFSHSVNVSIRIVNIAGLVIFNDKRDSASTFSADISNLRSGLYFVEIDGDLVSYRTKLLKY